MKLSKTVYLFLGILLIFTLMLFYTFTEKVEIKFSNYAIINTDFNLSEPVYIWYSLEYDGIFAPTIENAMFLTRDAKAIPISDSPIEVTMIEGEQGGVLYESSMKPDLKKIPLSGYKLSKNLVHMVFRIDEESDKEFMKTIDRLLVYYRVLGLKKTVSLDLELIEK